MTGCITHGRAPDELVDGFCPECNARARLISEVVGYFRIFDYHDVWKREGAASLVDWLLVRKVIVPGPGPSEQQGPPA